MYAWIDGERWAADGQPDLTERHGVLVAPNVMDPETGRPQWYGKLLDQGDELVIMRALLQSRLELVVDQDELRP